MWGFVIFPQKADRSIIILLWLNMNMYFINPPIEKINSALESWNWIGLEGKEPVRVTAFGDVFFQDGMGIWFLDTIEGSLNKVCSSLYELDKLLESEENQDHYLLAGFIIRANNEGMLLENDQCYDFKINPVLGGEIEFHNIERQDFVVAINIAGQLHDQIRFLPEGTPICKGSE